MRGLHVLDGPDFSIGPEIGIGKRRRVYRFPVGDLPLGRKVGISDKWHSDFNRRYQNNFRIQTRDEAKGQEPNSAQQLHHFRQKGMP